MARGPQALPSQQQKTFEKLLWRQTVMAIRRDVYEHQMSIGTVVNKWLDDDRLNGRLNEETILRVIFYKTARWVTEFDLPDGDTGFV